MTCFITGCLEFAKAVRLQVHRQGPVRFRARPLSPFLDLVGACADHFPKVVGSTVVERFWAKVRKSKEPDGCWEWTAERVAGGYGRFRLNGVKRMATAVSLIMAGIEVPHGMDVLHRCDNPPCVRPDHLFLGTDQDNADDCVAKGRHPHGETSGAAKITERAVREMRRMRASGALYREIADAFGVHHVTAMRTVKGELWSHVPKVVS